MAASPRRQSTTDIATKFLRRRQAMISALVMRVGGTALTAVGLVVGVRLLGAEQFGVSVLTLAVGVIAGFPATALERLVIRLTATRMNHGARAVVKLCNVYCWGLLALTILGTIAASFHSREWACFVAASGMTAVMSSLVTVRQGINRALGRLFWGQAPNEVFRPLATLAGYVAAHSVVPLSMSGSAATLMASAPTLLLILFAPSALDPSSEVTVPEVAGDHLRSLRMVTPAMFSLFIISAVAMAIERGYPLLIAASASSAEVAVFAVAMRIIQLGGFGQAFGIFFYSPQLALAMRPAGLDLANVQRSVRAIRLLGLGTALPAAVLCIFFPNEIEHLLGGAVDLSDVLVLTSIAVLVGWLGGPTQALLIMAGRERSVAAFYAAGALVSFVIFASVDASAVRAGILATTAAYASWNVAMIVRARLIYGRLL